MERLTGWLGMNCKVQQKPLPSNGLTFIHDKEEGMARHYSIKNLFRQMPNALLAQYFQAQGLFVDLDFTGMKEGAPEALFEAWQALSDTQRNPLEMALRQIFDMSCEKGWLAILDEARWQLGADPQAFTSFSDRLSALSSHYARAMITFLDYRACWKGATRFYHADMLSYWRKRRNLPHQRAAVDAASLRELADLISHYFRHAEGRGRHCVVEPYRRNDLDYFFAFPEDHSQQAAEWVNGDFQPRPHNPAFDIVYVYSQQEGKLDLNYRGGRQAVEPLQGVFARAILKLDELPSDPKDERVYDLSPLRERGFPFVFDPWSGIESVAVKKLRLSSTVRSGDRLTLEADPTRDREAVYALMDRALRKAPGHLYNVTQVELLAVVDVHEDKPARKVTIRITHPNSCSLKYDELGLRLRAMLAASGIEPKDMTEAVEPTLEQAEA
ncbi:hypothetical protein EDC35_10886 [Thiobaca trueperi]|uniref:Uncharacterized protein n=2 Tax=Thiobaca trueperi TaxID=127458 RepID=A0A4R3MSU6_9GAMM|nr:hypothetical protein EDC35_10886 [Thiobaca trueperi]